MPGKSVSAPPIWLGISAERAAHKPRGGHTPDARTIRAKVSLGAGL